MVRNNEKEKKQHGLIPIKKPEKEMSFKKQLKEFTKYYKTPDEFSKIFSELGFSYVKDGCSGNCISCKKKEGCETYNQIKECY